MYGYITGTNRLSSVYLNRAEKKYSYDNKGNVTIDESNKISNITYDHRNLPLSITSDKGTSKYRYNDHGDRIYKETTESGREYYLRDDKGREVAVYDLVSDKLRQINLFGTDQIGHIEVKWTNTWDENYEEWIETRSDRKVYYVKDHLGSIRQSIDVNGSLVSANDYYAFGQTKSYTVAGTTTDKYRYTGKERDQETGYDYFGARYYDSRIGRWLSVDPLAEEDHGWSPYNYAQNDPINKYDPDGRIWDKVAGGIIGAAVEYGFQVYDTKSWVPTKEGWAKIGVSALAGAVSSGVSSSQKISTGVKILSAALFSAAEGASKDAIDGKDVTKNVVTNLTVGAVGEAAGKVVTKVAQGTAKGRALAHDAKRAQNIADAGKKRISQTIKADKAKDKFDNYGAGNNANTAKAVVQGLIQKWLGN